MAGYNDDEQIAQIKEWWDEYGRSIVIGLLLAVAIVGGWNFWSSHKSETAQNASDRFYQMMDVYQQIETSNMMPHSVEDSISKHFAEIVLDLKTNFKGSEYANFAALQNAKYLVEKGDIEAAIEELRWLLNNNPSESIKLLTSLRLGRLLLAVGEPQAALKIAQMKNTGAYQSAYDELAGDVYASLGDAENAQRSYGAARDGSANVTDELNMKYYNLLEK